MQRIAIIAGEPSGDILGARLIQSLKAHFPDAQFEGIAGKEMQAAGCESLFPLESLSHMGLVEVLKVLPELLKIRRALVKRWTENPPDLFIGVDAPDFNLPVAKRLKKAGVKTVHYVSPSIWAWREKRVKKLQGHLDLMLTLFPFEVDFYKKHGIQAEFVGHPLADEITWDGDRDVARKQLALSQTKPLLAILPGSREGEIHRLLPDFLQAAQLLHSTHPELQFAIPAVHEKAQQLIESLKQQYAANVPITVIQGQSRTLMQASDYILLASGTAVLEGMLSGRLMVAAYRVNALTAWIIRTFNLLKVKYVTLPNNLANEYLVEEFLQEEATGENLAKAVERLIQLPDEQHTYRLQRFHSIQQQLKQQASDNAAQAIVQYLT